MNLIYTIAYGSAARYQASLLSKSLRGPGEYNDELIIFSDRSDTISGATIRFRPDIHSLFDIRAAKPYLGKDIDCAGYKKVMYLDSDIVAIRSIQPILDWVDGGAAPDPVMEESEELMEHGIITGRPVLNSGTIVTEASNWNQLCHCWWNTIVQTKMNHGTWPYSLVDEPAFNIVASTGVGGISPFPLDWVHIFHGSQQLNDSTILIHLCQRLKTTLQRAFLDLTLNLTRK